MLGVPAIPSTTSYYYSTDHLGSVRALHGDDGSIVADLDHDAFGNREAGAESVVQNLGYTGREFDRVTGLYHLRHREYDPNSGRFLQEDPIWFVANDMNSYRYAHSNPLRFADPTGLAAAPETANLSRIALAASAAQRSLAKEMNCVLGGIAAVLYVARGGTGLAGELKFDSRGCGATINKVVRATVKRIRQEVKKACNAGRYVKGPAGEKIITKIIETVRTTSEVRRAVYNTTLGKLIADATVNNSLHVEVKTYTSGAPSPSTNQATKYGQRGGTLFVDLCKGFR